MNTSITALDITLEGQPLVIPRTAIIDTGKRKVVWIKLSNKQFQAKEIHTGHESECYVEVKHGLMEGEEVVIEKEKFISLACGASHCGMSVGF